MTQFDFRSLRREKDRYVSAFEASDHLGSLVGATCVSLTDSECVYEYEVSARHLNPNGVLHGGALFTVMDSSQGLFIHFILDQQYRGGVTGTATVRYEKPVLAGKVSIRTHLERREGRKYFIRSVARQDEQVVATLDEVWIAIPNSAPG
jgi:uncharacterized protein (TIGR00369 family)